MKCNLCKEGDMFHKVVFLDLKDKVLVDPKDFDEEDQKILNKTPYESEEPIEGIRAVYIYNCEDCPNSQLEYYLPEDALAYALSMQRIYKLT